jgi:hypothetical protein
MHIGQAVKSLLPARFSDRRSGKERRAKARDMEPKLEALNRSQAVIEFGMDGQVPHANDNFLSVLGYTATKEIKALLSGPVAKSEFVLEGGHMPAPPVKQAPAAARKARPATRPASPP